MILLDLRRGLGYNCNVMKKEPHKNTILEALQKALVDMSQARIARYISTREDLVERQSIHDFTKRGRIGAERLLRLEQWLKSRGFLRHDVVPWDAEIGPSRGSIFREKDLGSSEREGEPQEPKSILLRYRCPGCGRMTVFALVAKQTISRRTDSPRNGRKN